MNRPHRRTLVFGLLLILLGAWLLAAQFVPGLQAWVETNVDWPLIIVAVGVLLLLLGLLVWVPAMAIPACIVAGIGGILWWQDLTGNWASWAYLWTLIPGFVGIGIVLAGLLRGEGRRALVGGGQLVVLSVVLFALFGYFFGAPPEIQRYWPVLLIVLGLWMIVRYIFRPRRREG